MRRRGRGEGGGALGLGLGGVGGEEEGGEARWEVRGEGRWLCLLLDFFSFTTC